MNFDFDYKKFSFDHPFRKGITTRFDQKKLHGAHPDEIIGFLEPSKYAD